MAQDKRQVEAITGRDVDFAQWYTDVCKKAELIDYSAVKGLFKEIAATTVFRLLIAPVIGLGTAIALTRAGILHCGLNEYPAMVALFGSPAAVASAIMATEMGGDEQLATQIVVWTSLLSIVTLFLIICVMMALGYLAV